MLSRRVSEPLPGSKAQEHERRDKPGVGIGFQTNSVRLPTAEIVSPSTGSRSRVTLTRFNPIINLLNFTNRQRKLKNVVGKNVFI